MKKIKNKKPKFGKKIKTPSINPESIKKDMKEIMETWKTQQNKEREELLEMSWPTWLTPEGFEDWYETEQIRRKDFGILLLPKPPKEVIREILGIDKTN